MFFRLPRFSLPTVCLLLTSFFPSTAFASCDLSQLILSSDSLATVEISYGVFDPNTVFYSVTVASSVTTVYVTPTAPDGLEVILDRFNGGDYVTISSGSTTPSPGYQLQPGENSIYVFVTCDCDKTYQINVTQSIDTGIHGDPQFSGLKGQSYQIHGMPNEYYNLISDPLIQYNSKFIFLNQGKCPTIDGVVVKGDCWTHPGTYLGELGLKTRGGETVQIIAGSGSHGFHSILYNGVRVPVGSILPLTFGSLSPPYSSYLNYSSPHSLRLEGAGFYSILISNSDQFLNQNLRVLNWELIASHGLLGQTWKKPIKPGQIKEIEGEVDDYLIVDHNLWSDNFVFNQFQGVEATGNKEGKNVVVTEY